MAYLFAGISGLFWAQAMGYLLVPVLGLEARLSGPSIGVLVATLAGTSVVTDVGVGALADRIGRRRPMLLGGLLGIGASAVFVVGGHSFVPLLLGSLLLGLALSFSIVPALALLTETYHVEQGAHIQGMNGAIQGLSALGGVVTATVMAHQSGPRSGFLALGVVMLAVITAFSLVRDRSGGQPRPSIQELANGHLAALRMLGQRPQIQLAALVSLVANSVCYVSGTSFLPIYVASHGGDIALGAGLPLALRSIAIALASLAFTRGVALGLPALVISANLLAIASVFAVALVSDQRLIALAFFLQGVGMGFGPATASTLIAAATLRSERALGFATNNLVARAGSLASPIVFGFALEKVGPAAVFVAAGALGCVYLAGMIARLRALASERLPPGY